MIMYFNIMKLRYQEGFDPTDSDITTWQPVEGTLIKVMDVKTKTKK